MAITAQRVKDLRERTGAGMMECKKALVETDGDMDAAVEHMRKRGLAKADKKADRVAADGAVIAALAEDGRSGAIVEINSETDFVANGDDFQAFGRKVANRILADDPADLGVLLEMPLEDGGDSLELAQKELVARVGENIQVRRFQRYATDSGQVYHYLHGSRIGVLLELEGGDEALGRDLCMHIAASRPVCVSVDDVPEEVMKPWAGICACTSRQAVRSASASTMSPRSGPPASAKSSWPRRRSRASPRRSLTRWSRVACGSG